MLAEALGSNLRSEIVTALKQASAATGSDFDFLLRTATRESGLHPQAKSGSSSARGLFQFIEQTWFGLVKEFGAKHGLASYANAITQNADGHFTADDADDRHAILALRSDPRISALMAGEYANMARTSLKSALGRGVSNGELYAAHFLGPEGACRLIRMNATEPGACAATLLPQAAESNRTVFYNPDGSAKSVREVYAWAVRDPHAPSAIAAPEITPQAPSLRAPEITHSSVAAPDDWAAMRLWAATQSGFPFVSMLLPQSRLAATPDVLDLLGALSGDESVSPTEK